MPNEPTIVTAFYDIGREIWPDYSRKNSQYFDSFKMLCELKNTIIVFTQEKFRPQFEEIIRTIKSDLIVFYDDVIEENKTLLQRIHDVQLTPQYLNGILTPRCPEYWSPHYVLVNFLKSKFCITAFERISNLSDTIAWIDFGYVKLQKQIPESKVWRYGFDDKIHMWNINPIPNPVDLIQTIKTNTVYMQGCHIIASKQKWRKFNQLMNEQLEFLLQNGLIDDDQTLMLMSFIKAPEEFKIHQENINRLDLDWFYIFQYFNQECNSEYYTEMKKREN